MNQSLVVIVMVFAYYSIAMNTVVLGSNLKRVPSTEVLKSVSTSINYYWGVNAKDEIFVCEKPCKTWKKIAGGLTQVDVSDSEVWGVNSAGAIYKRPADGSGTWVNVPGALTHVSASGNGYIWGVNKNDDIYLCKKPCSGGSPWKQIGGKLRQIDGGEQYVFGSNAGMNVYRRAVDGSGDQWKLISQKKLKYVSVGVGMVFGVDKDGNIWQCTLPCDSGDWVEIESCLEVDTVEAAYGEIVISALDALVLKKEV